MDYVSPVWSPKKGFYDARCTFCGKKAQRKFYTSTSNEYYACDCDEFIAYDNAYNKYSSELAKLSQVARARRQIWDQQLEIETKEQEVEELSSEIKSKQFYIDCDKKHQDEIKKELVKCLRIKPDVTSV